MRYFEYKGALFAGFELLKSDPNSLNKYFDKLLAAAIEDDLMNSVDMSDLYDYANDLYDQALGR